MAGGAYLAVAFNAQIEPFHCLFRSDGGDVAVIDRLLKPTLGGPALEPDAAPACDRLVRHVGIDIDTGHQTAAKAKAASDRIVMDLVFRGLGGVEGFDAVGAED